MLRVMGCNGDLLPKTCRHRTAGTAWTNGPRDDRVEDSKTEAPEAIMSGKSEYKVCHVYLFLTLCRDQTSLLV